MIKFLARWFAAGLLLAAGLASAQVFTRSVQLSQDTSGFLATDATQNLYLTGNRHLNAQTGSGNPPSLGTCTGGTLTANSTDFSGQVTGASAATCAVVFGQTYGTAPRCVVTSGASNAGPTFVSSVATTGFTWNQAATANTFNWVCVSVS